MKTNYLNEFENKAKNGVAYVPIGTIEWHGSQLPIETDFLIAQKICELVSKDYPGYILPPFYLGGYGTAKIDGKEMRGMDRKVGKKLFGNLYFLGADLLGKTLRELINNLKDQGFKKIIIVTGHGGSNHEEVLSRLENQNVLIMNPYEAVECHHADEVETSVFWACYPKEEARARAIKIPENDDLTDYKGYNPLSKSSLKLGKQNLDLMLKNIKKKIEEFLNK